MEKNVIIVGAGPYGLSAAAHLKELGIHPHVFGRPMVFWKENMPKGMILRSEHEASNISSPQGRLSFAAYQQSVRREIPEPIPIEDFIAYGEWFQQQVAPDVDTRVVKSISPSGSGFRLTLEDGSSADAKCVVLALGIGLFTYRPEQFAGFPKELVSHSSELIDPSRFKGKRVAVIGKGQSALESAALLHENQAQVEVLTRGASLLYLKYPWRRKLFRKLTPGPLTPLSYKMFPPTDLGGFITSRVIASPDKFRRQSPRMQQYLARSVTRPIGAYWLVSRMRPIKVTTSVTVESAKVDQSGVNLLLSDGRTTRVDHVVLATGYKIDVTKLGILDPSLRARIETNNGYPVLTTGLETSVPGLYFAGVIGEKTLGPTLRFVTGTSNASPRLAAAISRRQATR
jgi:cation diffusion facilitator CzcD-associated flavoprotein CzcO